MAWEVYQPVRSQISILNPDAPPDKRRTILNDASVFRSMRWEGVPLHLEREVYESVHMLHDVEYHRGKSYPGLCYHGLAKPWRSPECHSCREALQDEPPQWLKQQRPSR